MDTTELACARCDYDLRMLDRTGVCPECALPIGASVAAAADPIGPGRRGLHRAALVLLLAAAVHATTAAGAAGALAIEGLDHSIPTTIALVLDPWPLDVFFAVMRILRRVNDGWFTARLALVVAFVLQLAGIWLVTSAPSVRGGNRALRLTARWSAVVSVAPYVMAVLAIVFNVPFVGSLLGPTTAFVATVVPPVALAWWASHLLRRIRPSRPLLRWAAWSVIIASGAAAAFNERDYGPGHSLEWAGVGVTCVAFVAMTWIWWRLRRATRPVEVPTDAPAAATMP